MNPVLSSGRSFVVGLTGGIGSGKSTVAGLFANMGIKSIDADDISRALVAAGSPVLGQIVNHFGKDVLKADNSLDRQSLRRIVFSDPRARQWLEGLLHPLIRDEILAQLNSSSDAWILLTAPLLLENDLDSICNRVLVVDSPPALQISRTMDRDSTTEDEVKAIIASQMDRQKRLDRADDVICNDDTLAALATKVKRLKEFYDQQAGHSHQAG